MNDHEHNNALPETMFTNPGVLRNMSTGTLNSGQPYQRPVREQDVKKLIQHWDPTCFSPPIVSFRSNLYNLVDGQHRVDAMRRMNGGKEVTIPCLIFTGWTYEQEAEMYYKLDKASSHLKAAYSTKALLESGTDPEVIDIKQRIERAGFTWALDKPVNAAYEIKPTQTAISAYRKLGGPAFSRMLGLMAGAWHGVQPSLNAGMISGMALFLKSHENEIKDYEFIRRLSEVDPVEITQKAKVDAPDVRFAKIIQKKYNEMGGEELPDRFRA